MSNEDFLKLKAKDPFMALRLIIESNIPSSFSSPGYPKEFNPHYFESAHDGLQGRISSETPKCHGIPQVYNIYHIRHIITTCLTWL